jgi:hypothetical protein
MEGRVDGVRRGSHPSNISYLRLERRAGWLDGRMGEKKEGFYCFIRLNYKKV